MRRDADLQIPADTLEQVEADERIHAQAGQVDILGDGILFEAQETGDLFLEIGAQPVFPSAHGKGAQFRGKSAVARGLGRAGGSGGGGSGGSGGNAEGG